MKNVNVNFNQVNSATAVVLADSTTKVNLSFLGHSIGSSKKFNFNDVLQDFECKEELISVKSLESGQTTVVQNIMDGYCFVAKMSNKKELNIDILAIWNGISVGKTQVPVLAM